MNTTPISWTYRPYLRQRGRVVLAWIIIVLAVISVSLYDAIFAFLGFFLLVGSVSNQLLATHYRLTQDEVEVRNLFRWTQKPWIRFESWQVLENGDILLVARTPISFLKRRRSVRLQGVPDHAKDFVSQSMANAEQTLNTGKSHA